MKKYICILLCITVIIGMGLISTAFAAEKSQKEKYYAQYEKIVEEAEQQYNIE